MLKFHFISDCVGCNLFFAHPLHYRMHCVVFHDPQFSMTIRKYHCKICGAAVLGKENIVKHAASQHGGKGAYQCKFCKRVRTKIEAHQVERGLMGWDTLNCDSNGA
jgi:hypothetical protein